MWLTESGKQTRCSAVSNADKWTVENAVLQTSSSGIANTNSEVVCKRTRNTFRQQVSLAGDIAQIQGSVVDR
jgi:hypothetical protein